MSRSWNVLVAALVVGGVLGAGLGIGALIGYTEGYADAVGGTFQPNLQLDTVETEEEHVIDGYNIKLQHWNESERDGRVGYTTKQDDIYIRTNRSIYNTYVTCVHEKLHNQYPNKEHSWIYQESTERVDPTCLKLLSQIESHRPT